MATGTESQAVWPAAAPIPGVGRVRKRILVLSGLDGVGKSTLAVNLALGFAFQGLATGLLDADLQGPCVPRLLGLGRLAIRTEGAVLLPAELGCLKVMSLGFFLKPPQAAVWRERRSATVLEQFVRKVRWGALDVLVVDCPAGRGEAPPDVIDSLGRVDGAILVSTPEEPALRAARRAGGSCHKAGVPVLGILENLSRPQHPSCRTPAERVLASGWRRLAAELGAPFLGALPVDPEVAAAGEAGQPVLYRELGFGAQRAFQPVLKRLHAWVAARP
jgi:Mrp family chromosome partitioning ATPase